MSELFSRIAHSRTADEVIAQVEALVLEGVLRVGDRLPGERELSRQFDVSRPILRDALKQLEARGLLATRHGGGTYVADIIGQVFARPIIELISANAKATADYFEFRRDMEAMAADYAARRATADDKALLAGIVRRMEAAHEACDFDEEASIDVDFHSAISECAHNIVLLHTLRSCYRLLSEGVFANRRLVFNRPGAREMLLAQHRAIFAAIDAGDAAGARRAADEHITFVEQQSRAAERTGDWERVARLRLRHRAGDPPARRSVANG